ncbi:glycosyl hydrolase 115 family protein [Sphingomonas sp. UV9]|uniref:glycosyl hydrolase 115 family protein n=1 Tax=Sphingomonas sp. UV9 TaxID=1851410 RepID=UPI001F0BC595|nr:glycosyl hydrolase 115 family protein [Sphingomonas sp. UV9]
MITRRNMMGGAVAAGLMASPLAAAVRFDRRTRGFDITQKGGGVVPVFVEPDDLPGVRRAAGDLAADIGRVTGTAAQVVGDRARLPARMILVGSIGHSPLIDRMIASGKLDVAGIRDKWESFVVATIADPLPGVTEVLVIVGSDKRGAIYGAYELSRMIGVSPWYWWADVPVVRQAHLSIAHGRYVQGSPAVKYRGIFLNDEAPCLSGWTTEKSGGASNTITNCATPTITSSPAANGTT